MIIPIDDTLLAKFDENDRRDVWSIWADFRTLCGNYLMSKLAVGLKMGADLANEFLEPKLVERWKAEPVIALFFNHKA